MRVDPLGAAALGELGFRGQLAALAEEAAELAAACCRMLNEKGTAEQVAEEVVGVRMAASSIEGRLLTSLEWEEIEKRQRAKLALALQRRRELRRQEEPHGD